MSLFRKRRDKPEEEGVAGQAGQVNAQLPRPAADQEVSSSPQAVITINDTDLEKCSTCLRELETAIDLDDPMRGNAAAHALAVAAGYPSLTGKDLMVYRVMKISEEGVEAAKDIDLRPWRWLAAVASAACEVDNSGKLLAARLGLASWMWREQWKDKYENEVRTSAAVGQQFAEEVGLIPPPDDTFAIIVASGVKALGTLDDSIQVVRERAGKDGEVWSADMVLRLLSRELVELHQGKGVEFEPLARAVAYSTLNEGQ